MINKNNSNTSPILQNPLTTTLSLQPFPLTTFTINAALRGLALVGRLAPALAVPTVFTSLAVLASSSLHLNSGWRLAALGPRRSKGVEKHFGMYIQRPGSDA